MKASSVVSLVSLRRPIAPLLAFAAIALAGCANTQDRGFLDQINNDTRPITAGEAVLADTSSAIPGVAEEIDHTLAKPLNVDAAVRLTLLNSPAFQALLAQGAADDALARQQGRMPNPLLTLDRLRGPLELELGRMLTFGLIDVLGLPQRQRIAAAEQAQGRARLAGDVVEHLTRVRQAWVNAVAARQSLHYAQQVADAAEASAELARRMLAVGNFTKLQRARQQAFYADATAQLATASHAATATRESLIRQLGLTEVQALRLVLPDRLPDLPVTPRSPQQVSESARLTRLDIRAARAAAESAAARQGLDRLPSFGDIEISIVRNTAVDRIDDVRSTKRGVEVAVRLPVFDWGELRRTARSAQTLAAVQRLEATLRAAAPSLRESYSAYRTAYDLAKHYRDEIIPLRKQISEENTLRYNGMLIGVFELLADTREQVASVIAAINAEQQFWLADANLQATLLGRPLAGAMIAAGSAPAGGNDGGH